jgi:hypothetical protein
MRLVLRGTARLVLTGTEESSYRERKSALSHCNILQNPAPNLANNRILRILSNAESSAVAAEFPADNGGGQFDRACAVQPHVGRPSLGTCAPARARFLDTSEILHDR